MKAILVPVESHEGAEPALSLAALVATRFGSLVEGLALEIPPPVALTWDPASAAMIQGIDWGHDEARAAARSLFDRVMAREGIAATTGAAAGSDTARWRWNETVRAGDAYVGSRARAFDLTVVAQPGAGRGSIATLEAALFDGGGPILIVPPGRATGFGRNVAVAWNGSSETARTIAFAMPFLRGAERVTVLADDGGLGHEPAGEAVRERLELNGIPADLRLLPGGTVRSGEAILAAAEAIGADLLVKGAYTQSRLRQMIFGGATSHILAHARLPVLMAH